MEKMQGTKKRRGYAKGTGAMAFALLLCGIFWSIMMQADAVLAMETNGKNIYLQPGETYDATKAGNNTTVYMDKAGTYMLKGKSDNVRFVIKTGGITVYLTDGMHIDPGAYADNGKSASAISVQHKSGDVRLVSKKDASIYVGSHYRAPAIHQDGTDGTLIFATEDPDNPGTITAKSAKLGESAAIGSGRDKGTTGNIVFESGNIYATGDDYAAAIGGGNGGRARNITINGGYVKAQGGIYAAGIGSGMYEGAAYITINGGKVVAKGGKGGAGIGSGLEIEIDPIKGEHIKITGGEVEAVGGTGAAGIGGGRNADGEHIEISGGTVVAKGGDLGGAGIGGGGWFDAGGYGETSLIGGDGRYITISGGAVTATGGENGAGIGGGNEEGNGENITISDGTVVVSGGGSGAGIGGAWKGRAKDIAITGGKVTANGAGGGAGIGGGSMAWGRNLKISGGIVRANGGSHGDGIGGGKKPGIFSKDFTNSVFISGGTVVAKKGNSGSADIGGRGNSTVSITGGSVLAVNNAVKKQAKNQAGQEVYKTTVSFHNSTGGENKIDSLRFTSKTPAYGTKDIYNVNSSYCAVWLWLPKVSGAGVESGVLTEGGEDSKITKKYTALEIENQATDPWIMKKKTIAPGTSGTIYGSNDITLDSGRNSDGMKDGSATGEFLETKLGNFKPVEGSIPGMHIEGYSPSDISDECIADAAGNLKFNEFFSGTGYVNEKGRWITAASPVTLYAVWAINYYNVRFDANKPETASHEVTGEMANQRGLQYGVPYTLNANEYELKGWKFIGWHTQPERGTKPDGTKEAPDYTNGQEVMNLTAKHGETVTLYAQWEPKKYAVTFRAGEGGLQDGEDESKVEHIQTLAYDTPTKLNPLSDMGFTTPADKDFLGWGRKLGEQTAIGHYYKDQAAVYNLCTLDETSGTLTGYTLEAQWREENHDVVLVTLDGETKNIDSVGLPGEWDQILLQKDGEQTQFKMKHDPSAPGVYWIDSLPVSGTGGTSGAEGSSDTGGSSSSGDAADPQDAPANGTYQILLGKDDTTETLKTGRHLDISGNQLNVTALDYCTVNIELEPGSENRGIVWLGEGDDADGKRAAKTILLCDDPLSIHCDITKPGYRFAEYTVAGHAPDWERGKDKTEPNQHITVTGRTIITAHTEPIRYTVSFDANTPYAMGTMADQDFVYGHPQKLSACGFEREGYIFAGWTVTENWPDMESLYKDGETIGATADIDDNLATTHGAMMTLYAQWIPVAYDIFYDSNGADSGIQLTQHRSYHDNTTRLFSAKKLDFAMQNYHFTGWNTRSGGDGTAYEAGQVVSNLSGGADSITLYAQWVHDSYTVRYDANGGNGKILDDVFWIDAYEPLHQATFHRDGYTFVEWNTKRDGSGTSYGDREEVMNLAKADGLVTLYAQWKKDASGDGGDMDGGEGVVDGSSKNRENSKAGSDSSQTGDNSVLWIPVIVITMSALGAVSLAMTRRHKRG